MMIVNKALQIFRPIWTWPIHRTQLMRVTTKCVLNQKQEITEYQFYDIKEPQNDAKFYHEVMMSPIKYIEKNSFNDVISKYMRALNHWLKLDEDKAASIHKVLNLLHTSLFVLDDIQDNSSRRNGIPSAHIVFGMAMSINCATYAAIIAINKALRLGHPLAAAILTGYILEIHHGQGMELYWRDNMQCPSEAEYKEMVKLKTSSSFLLAFKLMQLFSNNKTDFSNLTRLFGTYLQILDDYCGICSDKYTEKKIFCEDITEGKFTLPIIHAIRNNQDTPVFNILRQRTVDEALKRFCVTELERCGSLQYTRDMLSALETQIRTEIKRYNGNPHLENLMDELLSWQ